MGGDADSVNLGKLPSFYYCKCDISHNIFAYAERIRYRGYSNKIISRVIFKIT